MSAQKLSAFEKRVLAGLACKAGLAATILDAWAGMPETSVQSERSLIDLAQLGVTEERAAREVLDAAVELGLLIHLPSGFQPRGKAHAQFKRLAYALNAIDFYVSSVHTDMTISRVVLTKPAKPSKLEQKLSELGWRTSDIEPTDHAFHSMVRSTMHRIVVMTPFFDVKGAIWLQELFTLTQPGVERVLILRSLENPTWDDYPKGYDSIALWLKDQGVRIFNYSVPRPEGHGRETFHAKVILCDRSAAYVGSSNITSASMYSMEMGVILQGKAASDVAEVLNAVLSVAAPRG